ncbi:MAG: TonB family protein [Bacteroidales bacterium]|nr:TonB family protein [Bacteroidales bacterium]MCF8458039.1 TonB family protein [Bacteroidales bacterium]
MDKIVLFNKRGCLALEAMTAYSKHKLRGEEFRQTLKHLKECRFCSEAFDGIVQAIDAEYMVNTIKVDIASRFDAPRIIPPKPKRRYLIISLAASVAILLGIYFLLPKAENTGTNNYAEMINLNETHPTASPPAPDTNKIQSNPEPGLAKNEALENPKRLMPSNTEKQETEFLSEVFTFTDEMPEFPGGIVALNSYIQKNIRAAEETKEVRSCGVVYVEFVVNETGKVAQSKVVNGRNPKLDQIALELIEALPDWKPGRQSGQLVKVSFTLPIRFDKC